MRLHRFYVEPATRLKHDFWLREPKLLWQWRRVLRYKAGQQVVLFDGEQHERLYEITSLSDREAHLKHITDFVRKVPAREVYLLWTLLKKDKNDWVLQKCTELGVRHFMPLLSERAEKTGFGLERARKIVLEAVEQCGRSDIPVVREPMHVTTALDELAGKAEIFVCEQDGEDELGDYDKPVGVLIGPEGGWSEAEKALFRDRKLRHLNLHDFTLRAETAAVAVTARLLA